MPKLPFLTVLAALGVISAAAAIVLNMTGGGTAPPERPPAPETETAARPAPAPEPAPEPAPAAPETAAVTPPAFDVVRVGPDGGAVIAGRAAPGAAVDIRLGDKKLGEAAADARGEWVFVLEEPLPPGEAVLSLAMRTEGRDDPVLSQDSVLIVVPGPEAETEAAALALKIAPDGTTRLLTGPDSAAGAESASASASGGGGGPVKARTLTVETIDYSDEGRISIGGRAEPGAAVTLYIDNKFAGNALAGADGFWRVTPETETAPGKHTVRADLTAADGGVAARTVIPFMREEIRAPAAPGDFITVQPGNSLWRIARRAYGSGFSYTVIYRANAGQIADPDLIYPGQIFKLPAAE